MASFIGVLGQALSPDGAFGSQVWTLTSDCCEEAKIIAFCWFVGKCANRRWNVGFPWVGGPKYGSYSSFISKTNTELGLLAWKILAVEQLQRGPMFSASIVLVERFLVKRWIPDVI